MTRFRRRVRRARRHARYYDPYELGVTTTTCTDETW